MQLTNEELCVLIKNGDDGLLPTLWEQVRKYVVLRAKRFYGQFDKPHGCEVDDLIQVGFLAVVEAVKYYDPEKGYKFTTFLGNTLKNAFKTAMGIRTSKRDWLDYAKSLDEPIGKESDMTLLDSIGDLTPGEADVEETVIVSVWNQELRAALNDAMSILSEKQRELLELQYYYGLGLTQIAEIRGCNRSRIDIQRYEALDRIYNSKYRKILAEFLYDYEPDPYAHTSLKAFRQLVISSEEAFLIQLGGETRCRK